jgi:alkyl sulfatase BDS1-like metallo-beta-lactamase superfamily hydrolase
MKYTLLLVTLLATLSFAQTQPKDDATQKAIKAAMEKEKKFAQEQKFYQGDEYDLKSEEIDPKTIDSIPSIEPENDFDMSTGVYD